MKKRHRFLNRQLKIFFSKGFPKSENYAHFLDAVNNDYWESEKDRHRLERLLELSSHELLEANSDLQAIIKVLPDILFKVDYKGKIVDCTVSDSSQLYSSKEKLIGKKIYDVPAPMVKKLFMEGIERVKETKSLITFEYPMSIKGKKTYFEARMTTLQKEHIIIIVRDITKRKRPEKELERSLSLLRATIESTTDGILVVDNDGKIIDFNQKFIDMWQVPLEIIQQKDDNKAIQYVLNQLKDPDLFLKKVKELYSKVDSESHDILEFKDGRLFERFSRPQKINGATVGRVWSFLDITERKNLEEQFRRSQRMEAIGRLAGGIAHDFNNLLTTMTLSTGYLLRNMPKNGRFQQDMETINQAIQRASDLTRQLLAFGRVQFFKLKVLRLNDIIIQMNKMFSRVLGERIKVETNLYPKLWNIHVDHGMIEQVVMNLVVNAKDSILKKGKVTIKTQNIKIGEGKAKKTIDLNPGEYILMEVSDTGVGIDEKNLLHIFEPFFTTKEMNKGTGLGLSTVYGIVKQSNGHIEVKSKKGEGTSFKVYLPKTDLVLRSEDDSLTPFPMRKKRTILFVEDEEPVRSAILRELSEAGYHVLDAENGEVALEIFRKKKDSIELLISDVVMPSISGPELARKLVMEKSSLRILFISGYAKEAAEDIGFENDNMSFLSKPFSSEELHNRIEKIFKDKSK